MLFLLRKIHPDNYLVSTTGEPSYSGSRVCLRCPGGEGDRRLLGGFDCAPTGVLDRDLQVQHSLSSPHTVDSNELTTGPNNKMNKRKTVYPEYLVRNCAMGKVRRWIWQTHRETYWSLPFTRGWTSLAPRCGGDGDLRGGTGERSRVLLLWDLPAEGDREGAFPWCPGEGVRPLTCWEWDLHIRTTIRHTVSGTLITTFGTTLKYTPFRLVPFHSSRLQLGHWQKLQQSYRFTLIYAHHVGKGRIV